MFLVVSLGVDTQRARVGTVLDTFLQTRFVVIGKAVSSVEYTLTLQEVSASERDQVEPARAASVAASHALQSIDKRVDSD